MNLGFPLLTLATLGLNYIMNRENNEANEEIHKEDREFNRQERLETQAWNSPTQMVARGQAAGLNRMAALGLPASVASSAPSPIPMEPFQVNPNAFGDAAESGSNVMQNESDSRLKDMQAQNVALSNAFVNQKNELEIMKGIKELDNMDIEHDLKDSMRDNYLQQLEHNRKMSSLLQENQTFQNNFIEQQRLESIQNVAESQARVVNEQIRLQLQSKEVRSRIGLNAAQSKQFMAAADNLSWQSAKLQFDADMETRKQNFFEEFQSAETYLKGMDIGARVELVRMQAQIAGLDLERMARENDSSLNKWLQENVGITSRDLLGAAPKLILRAGKK